MSTTLTDARDAIGLSLQSVIQGLDTQPAVVFWDDVEPESNPASADDTWLRIKIWPAGGTQVSVGAGTTGTGKFRHSGLVTVRIFTPLRDGMGTSDEVAQAFINGLQGRESGEVWYENVRAVGSGRTDQWTEQRVVADYFYDDNR